MLNPLGSPVTGTLLLNRIARDEARALGVRFVDLHEAFAQAYREKPQRFEHPCDWHWNRQGHAVAAQAIRDGLL